MKFKDREKRKKEKGISNILVLLKQLPKLGRLSNWLLQIMKSLGADFVNFNLATAPVEYGEVNGNPLQYSCLENPMGRGA